MSKKYTPTQKKVIFIFALMFFISVIVLFVKFAFLSAFAFLPAFAFLLFLTCFGGFVNECPPMLQM